MSQLHRVLAEIRAGAAATSIDDLARRLSIPRDDLDAMIGYWVHRGELMVEGTVSCGGGSCGGCPVAAGCGSGQFPRRPVLVTIRPTPSLTPTARVATMLV
jgi:hypothetical protein